MKYLLATPKFQLVLFLFIIILVNLLFNFSLANLVYFVLTVTLTVIFDYIFLKIRRIKPFFLSAAIITGMIIALLNSPTNSWLETLSIIFLATISKHFIKIENRHIFNPAAFGLFFGSLIFKTPVAWWGISSIYILYIILTGYVSVFRSRKLYLILSFLISYLLIVFFSTKSIDLFDPVLIFFSLVMLPEPITSPNRPIRQIFFGAFTAVFTIILSYFTGLPDILTASLLITNLAFVKFK